MTQADQRAAARFGESYGAVVKRTNRLFLLLLFVQWAVAIMLSLTITPYSWRGDESTLSPHVWAATLGGALLNSLPVALALLRPQSPLTRHVMACAQMLWSGLLIHLTNGRIETHFHVFGSLAFLAFYRDWRVVGTATVVTALDHAVRGMLAPLSVYGVQSASWLRVAEHGGWVIFCDIFLVWSCVIAISEMRQIAQRQAEAELLAESERRKSMDLDLALAELRLATEASH